MAHKIGNDTKNLVIKYANKDNNTVCTEVAQTLYYTLTDHKFDREKLVQKRSSTHMRTIINRCKNSILHLNLLDEKTDMILHSFIIETRRIGKKTYYKVYNAWVNNYCLADWMLNRDGKIDPVTFREFGAFRYRDLSADSNFIDKLEIMLNDYTPARSKELFGVDVGSKVSLLYHQRAIRGLTC